MAAHAHILDLPVELIEMIAFDLSISEIGHLRLTHSQLNSFLIDAFCRDTTFRIDPNRIKHSTASGLANKVRLLKLADTHITRFFDYRITENNPGRDHWRWKDIGDVSKAWVQSIFGPADRNLALFVDLISSFTNLEEIATFHSYCIAEVFAKHPDECGAIITYDTIEYGWNKSATFEDFQCKCGSCRGRRAASKRDLCYAAGIALAMVPRYNADARFDCMTKLDLFFPASTIQTPSIIWADLADFVLLCPNLEVLWLQISSSDHTLFEAPISIFMRALARGIDAMPLKKLHNLFLKDNPCRSSRALQMNDLLHILNSVSSTLESLGLIFGQLRCDVKGYNALLEWWDTAADVWARFFIETFEEGKEDDEPYEYQVYRKEYKLNTPEEFRIRPPGGWFSDADSECDSVSSWGDVFDFPKDERVYELGNDDADEPNWELRTYKDFDSVWENWKRRDDDQRSFFESVGYEKDDLACPSQLCIRAW